MNIKKNILTLSLSALLFFPNAQASKLPDDVLKFVKLQLPTIQQRFDSVIIINDDVMYIPLYPPTDTTVDSIKVEYTYPQGKSLKELPEVVLLNNGYSLLKVFKDENNNYTLTKKDDLPIKVRLGLMPQDMLTPAGLKMPESLKLTLGDLLIPSKDEQSLVLKKDNKPTTVSPYSPAVKRNEFIPTVELKDKKTFILPRNSKFLSVYNGQNQKPIYELKLTSMPLKIISSDLSKVALVLYWNNKNAEIIDLKDERVIATIELESNATDMVLNKNANVAYVTSQNSHSISIINLNSMQLERIIKLNQKPSKIAYSKEDNSIAFVDEYTSKVYSMKEDTQGYSVQPLGDANNVSKVLADENNVYAISRTQAELYVFDKTTNKLKDTITIDKKPTDAILYNSKLFILCAKEGYMDVYDTIENKLISREQLSKDGFYSKITLIPGEDNILITGISSKNYLVYNLGIMKLTKVQESYVDVSNIIILDKSQRL